MAVTRLRLAQRRKAAGYTQEQLAERLGVERETVGRWERGENEPQPWIRPKLAQMLDVTLDQLDELLALTSYDAPDIPAVDESVGPRTAADAVTASAGLADLHQVELLRQRLNEALSDGTMAEASLDDWERTVIRHAPKTLKHISYWEKWEPNALPSNSARAPSYRDLDRLAQLYECSVSDLLEYPDYSDRDVNAHGKSMVFSDIHDEIRSLRHRLTEPTAAIVTPGLHRDDNYTRTPIRTGLLAQYESLTNSYRQIDYQAGARTVYSDTIAHLNRLLVASDKVSSALYRRYAALLSDTAQLAAWLAIDGQDYVTARHFCSIALSGAEECEDATLRSYVLGVMSYIHLHARRGGEALRLLESALRIANTPRLGVHSAVRSWLYEAMAESYAFSGDRSSGVKALRRAEQLFDAVQPDSVPRWLGFFNSQEHAARLQGRCLMRLGEGRAAITTLQAACDLLPDHYVRERSGTLIDLASAQIMDANQFTNQPEPEAAASTLQEAWRLADLTNSGRNQRRVRELIPSFQPYAHLDSIQSLTHMVQ